MKNIIILCVFIASLLVNPCAFAQESTKNTADLKAEIAALQVRLQTAETKENTPIAKFSGIGTEMGIAFKGFIEAIDGGMASTTSRVNEFAQTDVGKFAMIGIGWKIFAKDFFDIFIGILLLLMFFVLLKWYLVAFFFGRMLVTKVEGPWYNRKITKERYKSIYQQIGSFSAEQIAYADFFSWTGFLTLAVILITAFIFLT